MSRASVAARPAKPKGHNGRPPAVESEPSAERPLTLADLVVTFPTFDKKKPSVTVSGREIIQLLRVRHQLEKWGSQEEYVCLLLDGLAETLSSYAFEAERGALVEIPAASLEFAELVIKECVLRLQHAQPEDGPTALDYRVEAAVVGGSR